ncbi:hypothetical protein [Azoarcus sp. KH32C]|uniref:hypothetical protein n=1 Tax=Azoarcus sp. KH32C TaxID=748247 RepID=UPI000870911B|nr:hypothetical protein [Azoarcus sp. KH32C]
MKKQPNVLSRIWNWLTSSTERRPKSKHPDLYSLSDLAIAEELDIRQEAARLGTAGLPAPGDTQLSAPEAQVIHRIERARLDYIDWANTRIQVLNEDLSRLDALPVVNRALQADQEFSRKASALLDEREPHIRTLARASEQRDRELGEFKERNQLTRGARYPTGGGRFWRFAVFAALIILEGFANAFFFAQGVSTGLIGGFLTATTLASLNVIAAALQGRYTIPFVTHTHPALKLLGVVACVTAIALMLTIGLGISHYREALSVDAESSAQLAITTLKSSPFGLRDFMSFILLGVSVLFAVIALFDGLFLSDTYPFYASKTKHYLEAKLELDDELDELRDELNELKKSSLNQLNDDTSQVQRLLSQQESLIQTKDGSKARLMTALHDAEHCMRSLLALFRQENQIHRNGLPPPRTFASLPDLKRLPIPDFDVAANRRALETQQHAADELASRLESIRASIQAAFNREFDKLRPLGTHLHDGSLQHVAEAAA